MARRFCNVGVFKTLLLCVTATLITSMYLAFAPISEPCNCDSDAQTNAKDSEPMGGGQQPQDPVQIDRPPDIRNTDAHNDNPSVVKLGDRLKNSDEDDLSWGPYKLAVIVPHRDRFEELMEFIPYINKFLKAQKVRHKIFIINQVDSFRFNRASLINIGFLQSQHECQYLAMHDVDLLPLNPMLNYSYPDQGPLHVAAPNLHPRYHYPTFVGGILLLTNEQFRLVNGLSNRFWGWGREDDELYVRMIEANLKIQRPQGIKTGLNTFKHNHDRRRRPRDGRRYGDQKRVSRRRDRETGLDTVQYEVDSIRQLTIDGAPATLINVRLKCNLDETPWCQHPTAVPQPAIRTKPQARMRL